MEDRWTETAMGRPHDWSLLPDMSWEKLTEGQEDTGVRRLTAFPIERSRGAAEAVLDRIQRYMRKLFAQSGKGGVLIIQEVPLRLYIAKDSRFFMEDFERIPLASHDAYAAWYEGNQKNSFYKNEFLAIGGISRQTWRICTRQEALYALRGRSIQDFCDESAKLKGVAVKELNEKAPTAYYPIRNKGFDFSDERKYNGIANESIADIYAASISPKLCLLEFLLKCGYSPRGVDKQLWDALKTLYEDGMVTIAGAMGEELAISPTDRLVEAVRAGECPALQSLAGDGGMGMEIKISAPEALFAEGKAELLRRDSVRADLTEYDAMQLEDPNRGSWELWDPDPARYVMMSVPTPVYARDPRMDIQQGGVIGIDFGTKSTVVVRQDDSDRIEALRVGTGRFEREVRAGDYENPTVMQFVDLDSFLRDYHGQEGRPLTAWADLAISYTAFNNWKDNSDAAQYASFFGELKQWAGTPDRRVRIRDRTGSEKMLPPYLNIREGDFDPIELYAYYIGLFINNMYQKIYLEYLLSFPVTYSQAVRRKILDSFRRGLLKSLPKAIHDDPDCLKRFSVSQGAGEPAAYAVCALQEYGFQPQEGEKVYYGIFDFGGGTADFDFGVWRKASGPKERRYGNVIQHFGDGGDPYLGGENLLEMLAFEVFKRNQNTLRQKGITFTLPADPAVGVRFAGSELLIADSQEAHTNTRQMMERLRPLWERIEGYENDYSGGKIQLRLFKRDGGQENEETVELDLDAEKLERLLTARIRKGIDAFFDAMFRAFHNDLFRCEGEQQICIFLAGNAAKSALFQTAFEEKIREVTQELHAAYQKRGEDDGGQEYFVLYPPLGTPEAEQRQQELALDVGGMDEKERPTGKTGVAIGLVRCRSGSRIKVVHADKAGDEINFGFWIGAEQDGYFQMVLGRETPYQKWVEYLDAGEPYFEFYYTQSPTAAREKGLLVREAKKCRRSFPESAVNEDWCVYLRAVAPNALEFAVARSLDDVQEENYCCGPEKILLEP